VTIFPAISFWRFTGAGGPRQQAVGLAQIPKVVGGVNPPSGRAAQALYAQVVSRNSGQLHASGGNGQTARKYFRCVNIALVNELKLLSLRMGIDIWEVIDAASTKPFGFMPFYPGLGWAGIAFQLTLFIFRGRHANTTLRRDSSSWRAK